MTTKSHLTTGIMAIFLVVVLCPDCEACWRLRRRKSCCAQPMAVCCPPVSYAPMAYLPPGPAPMCVPPYIPVNCIGKMWVKVEPEDAIGCIREEFLNQECDLGQMAPRRDFAADLVRLVCDSSTHTWRRAKDGEVHDALLPSSFIGKKCKKKM